MTSKERLHKTLRGELADRVPISTYELCGFNSKAFENNDSSYKTLMEYIRAHTDGITMYNPREISAASCPSVTERWDEGDFHVVKTVLKTKSRDLIRVQKRRDAVMTTWTTEHFCKDTKDVDAWLSIPFAESTYDYSDYTRVAAELGENGIVMASVSDPACTAMELMEFGEATVWALTEPEHFKETLDEIHRRQMINLKTMLETKTIDLYRVCGPEYITPPYLSPRHFERYVYPYIREMTGLIQRFGGKVRIHSHGKIGTVLDMIVDSGADAVDPCEAPPDGDISLYDIKQKTKDRMTVFGNLQLKLLENGTAEQVHNEVRLCMGSAKEGGRYVIMPTAAPINRPLNKQTERNYMIFIDAALEYGYY